jgi:hypothetical protein
LVMATKFNLSSTLNSFLMLITITIIWLAIWIQMCFYCIIDFWGSKQVY